VRYVLPLVFVAAMINFAAFFIVAGRIGGDAINGTVENGHYYLASHGRMTEVSAGRFTYSLWHARSLFVTHPLGMIAGGCCAVWLWRRLRIST
jgi:hypothetical protein